jgi:alkanesulfonate monooxygenase SsuD/methylene tetrahydromethanopterin reductase-like flavin-dependent oxidoreductase (luciferase family)
MNIGLLMPFRNPPRWRQPFTEFYAEQFRQIQFAEQLGYDTAWLTEHHFAEDGYSPSLLPIASAVGSMTSSIRIGTYVLLLPLHNAIRIAEDAATVDIISNGRFDLGVGQGYTIEEFEGYGVSRRERGSRLEEGVEVIRGVWSHDDFSYRGLHYHLNRVTVMPKPVQTPAPIWIGGHAQKAVTRAARLGCHFMGGGDPATQRIYDSALADHGRDPSDFSAAQLKWVYVAPTVDEAWDDAQDHLHYMLTWYSRWLDAADERPDRPSWQDRAPLPPAAELRHGADRLPSPSFVGTPETVAAQLEEMIRTCRTTHLALGMHLPGIDPAKSRQSMELFAKEVMPDLRRR